MRRLHPVKYLGLEKIDLHGKKYLPDVFLWSNLTDLNKISSGKSLKPGPHHHLLIFLIYFVLTDIILGKRRNSLKRGYITK